MVRASGGALAGAMLLGLRTAIEAATTPCEESDITWPRSDSVGVFCKGAGRYEE
jgi:hypothetical protein